MMSALALMSACSNDEKEIREVAYNYSYALANYKIEDATQYCTKETQETSLAYGLELMKGVSAEYIASDTPATIEIEGIEMTSDTTATAQYHKKTPIKDFMAINDLNANKCYNYCLQEQGLCSTPFPGYGYYLCDKALITYSSASGFIMANGEKVDKEILSKISPEGNPVLMRFEFKSGTSDK